MQNWCTDKQSPRGCSTKEGKARFSTAIGGFLFAKEFTLAKFFMNSPSNKNMFAFLSAGHDLTSLRCICVNTFVPYICLHCMFLKGHESQIARICGWGRRLTLIKIPSVNVGGMNWIRYNEVISEPKYMFVHFFKKQFVPNLFSWCYYGALWQNWLISQHYLLKL